MIDDQGIVEILQSEIETNPDLLKDFMVMMEVLFRKYDLDTALIEELGSEDAFQEKFRELTLTLRGVGLSDDDGGDPGAPRTSGPD